MIIKSIAKVLRIEIKLSSTITIATSLTRIARYEIRTRLLNSGISDHHGQGLRRRGTSVKISSVCIKRMKWLEKLIKRYSRSNRIIMSALFVYLFGNMKINNYFHSTINKFV